MDHIVTKQEAAAVLPVLRTHAAALLEGVRGEPAKTLAALLRAGQAGGNSVEGLNQNFDHDNDDSWPEELDTFWRVLCAFEEVALDGHMQRGGTESALRNPAEQPRPWMLHAAAHALFTQGERLTELAETYRTLDVRSNRKVYA